MLVKDIDRFATNFGVDPNSIDLKTIWTTPFHASNLENNGPSFSNDSDFGDGLTGLGRLGDLTDLSTLTTDLAQDLQSTGWATSPSINLASVSSLLPDTSNWSWMTWVGTAVAGYFIIDSLLGKTRSVRSSASDYVSGGVTKRKAAKSAKASYKQAKKDAGLFGLFA